MSTMHNALLGSSNLDMKKELTKETTELNQQEPKKQESRVQESSENDHKEQDRSMPSLPAGSKDEVKSTEPISVKVVDERFNELAKKELREKNKKEIEEFLDQEKEKLYIEAENWRKTAQDLDLDLQQSQKCNEKIIKDKLGLAEDFKKSFHSCRTFARKSTSFRGRSRGNENKS